MNRMFRMRRWDKKTGTQDTMFPQTVTENILRRDNGGVVEQDLQRYDYHLSNGRPHLNRCYSSGTHRHLKVFIPNLVLVDNLPLLLTLHTELDCEATLDFNHSGPKPIINGAGERIPGGQIPGAIILLVYSERMGAWIMQSNDNYSDVTRLVTPVEHQYYYEVQTDGEAYFQIPGFNRKNMRLNRVNYGQTLLVRTRDYEFDWATMDCIKLLNIEMVKGDIIEFRWTSYTVIAKRGGHKYDLVPETKHIVCEKDEETIFMLPTSAETATFLELIYGQTLLREGLDYTRDPEINSVTLTFPLMKDDILTVNVTNLMEVDGDLLPNNWGTKGTYRYHMDVLHGNYEAKEDHITVIPVPKYDHLRDEITVIRDNKLLIQDVDYTIDLLDQIVLLTGELNKTERLYWTIMKHALFDVPDFNVIDASGNSGQHILVDIHDNIFCNFYVLLIRLRHDLQTAPTIKGINGPARPVADCFGNPVLEGYKAGSFLWCVFNEDNQTWYSLGHGQLDVTSRFPTTLTDTGIANYLGNTVKEVWYGDEHTAETVIPHQLGVTPTAIDIQSIEPPNIDPATGERTVIGDVWCTADDKFLYVGNTGNATSQFRWKITNQDKTTNLTEYLESEIAKLKNRASNIVQKLQVVTIEEDHTTFIEVDWYGMEYDKILVNYGQTILREDIDFVRATENFKNGIKLTQMELMEGDIIQFCIIKQESPDPTKYKLS